MADPDIPSSAPLSAAQRAQLDPKQRMVATAAKLFQRQGYHATGLKQIVDEAAAPRGSIYHHFPGGKEQLGVSALQAAAAELTRAIGRASDRTDSPGDLVRALGRSLARWLLDSDYTEGCPVSTVVLETAPGSEPLTRAAARAYSRWQEMLAERIRSQGITQEEADELSTTVLAGLLGALLLCRASRSTAHLEATSSRLAGVLDQAGGRVVTRQR